MLKHPGDGVMHLARSAVVSGCVSAADSEEEY